MWWNLKIVSPEPQPNKNTKVKTNKQKPNRITSAEANNVQPTYCQTACCELLLSVNIDAVQKELVLPNL
jgi:hypothetical protein